MPNKCCVPNCKTNYKSSGKKYISVFKFPKNAELRKSWINAIPKKNFIPGTHSVVCENHFDPNDVIYEKCIEPDGTTPLLRYPRLKEKTIPTVFMDLDDPTMETDHSISNVIAEVKEQNNSALLLSNDCQQAAKGRSLKLIGDKRIPEVSKEAQLCLNDRDEVPNKVLKDFEINGYNKPDKGENNNDVDASNDLPESLNLVSNPVMQSAVVTRITQEVFDDMCRCCLVHKGEINLFEAHFENQPFSELLYFCTNEKIISGDELPRSICNVCLQLVISTYTFVKKVKDTQFQLRVIKQTLAAEAQAAADNNINGINEEEINTENCDSVQDFKHKFRRLNKVYSELCDVLVENRKQLKRFLKTSHKVPQKEVESKLDTVKGSDSVNTKGTLKSILSCEDIDLQSYEEEADNEVTNVEVYTLPDNLVEENLEIIVKSNYADFNNGTKSEGSSRQDTVNKASTIECSECSQAFQSEASLDRHCKLTGHLMMDRFKCKTCSSTFGLRRTYIKHIKYHRGLKKICEICGARVNSNNLRRHLEIHSMDKNHVCQYCGKAFSQKVALTDHLCIVHSEKSYKFLCAFCGKLFKKMIDLNKHLNRGHKMDNIENKSYSCEFCEKYFVNEDSLTIHIRYLHGEEPVNRRRYKKEEESSSQKSAKLKMVLKEEMRNMRKHCSICLKSIHYTALKPHMLMHQGIKPFRCNICCKAFRQRAHLRTHMNLHSGRKPYKCSYCDKCFGYKSTLKAHIQLHTGETPYKCNVCNKRFAQLTNLKKHSKIHTRLKKVEVEPEIIFTENDSICSDSEKDL